MSNLGISGNRNLVGVLTIRILIAFAGSMRGPPICENFQNGRFIYLRVVRLISRLMYLQVVSGLEFFGTHREFVNATGPEALKPKPHLLTRLLTQPSTLNPKTLSPNPKPLTLSPQPNFLNPSLNPPYPSTEPPWAIRP